MGVLPRRAFKTPNEYRVREKNSPDNSVIVFLVQARIFSNLMKEIQEEKKKPTPRPLRSVIEDWKNKPAGPFITYEKETIDTNYKVLSLNSSVDMFFKRQSDSQCIIDEVQQELLNNKRNRPSGCSIS
jgi:hypothetical protein